MVYEWKTYINFRWKAVSKIFEYEMRENSDLAEQWAEYDEIPKEMHERIKWLCSEIIPVKTKSVELIDLILEHIIISSMQAQLLFLLLPYDVCVTNTIYACFTQLKNGPIFKNMIDEYSVLWTAVCKIQKCWRRCISNPDFYICKRRIKRECEELNNYIRYK